MHVLGVPEEHSLPWPRRPKRRPKPLARSASTSMPVVSGWASQSSPVSPLDQRHGVLGRRAGTGELLGGGHTAGTSSGPATPGVTVPAAVPPSTSAVAVTVRVRPCISPLVVRALLAQRRLARCVR